MLKLSRQYLDSGKVYTFLPTKGIEFLECFKYSGNSPVGLEKPFKVCSNLRYDAFGTLEEAQISVNQYITDFKVRLEGDDDEEE